MVVGTLALVIFPFIGFLLFRQFPLKVALLWTIILGYLFLPSAQQVGFDLPALPAVDKTLIPSLTALVLALMTLKKNEQIRQIAARRGGARAHQLPPPEGRIMPGWLPENWVGKACLVAMFFGAVMTVMVNGDAIISDAGVLPGIPKKDIVSILISVFIAMLPFLVARKFLADEDSHRLFLHVFCLAGLLYSLPTLYEVRMSPQLNAMVYGFFPHSWVQHIRADGWRPLVFLDHGLHLAIFLGCSIIATAALIRGSSGGAARFGYVAAIIWLLFTMVMQKSLGALLISGAMIPIIIFLSVRLQLLVVAAIAICVLSYPVLRGSGVIPTERIIEWSAQISTDRAGSLEYRFDNEDLLLERANLRPIFGWGGWGRSRIFDENGNDVAITDGSWVIMIGQEGWFGYLAKFGILAFPLIFLALYKRRYQIGILSTGLSLMLAANLIDLMPNASITPILWLMGGALMGRLEQHQMEAEAEPEEEESAEPVPVSRYTRFGEIKHRAGRPMPGSTPSQTGTSARRSG